MKPNLKHLAFALTLALILSVGGSRPAARADTSVSGTIYSDTTWTLANSPYVISDNLNVADGATLTIQPGVEVRVNSGIWVTVQGRLKAIGTAAQPITFTSATGDGTSQWAGLHIQSFNESLGQGLLDYVTIRYGGQTLGNGNCNLCLWGGAAVSVTHSLIADGLGDGVQEDLYGNRLVTFANNTVQNNAGYALSLYPNDVAQVVNNTFSGNNRDRVLVYSTNGGTVYSGVWHNSNSVNDYELAGDVSVDANSSLTIEPGVEVRGRSGVWLYVKGRLKAIGTAAQPILFTSALDDGAGEWVGLSFDAYNTGGLGRGILDYVTVRYGGQSRSSGNCNLCVWDGAAVSVTHSLIAGSAGDGVQVDGNSRLVNFANNVVQNNAGYALDLQPNDVPRLANNTLSGNNPNRILVNGGTVGLP